MVGRPPIFLEVPGVGLLPKVRAISKNNAWYLGQPRSQLRFEVAVLLIDGCEFARAGEGLVRKTPKIPVLSNFCVVNETLTADSLQQGLSLSRGRVTTKTITNLHVAIIVA